MKYINSSCFQLFPSIDRIFDSRIIRDGGGEYPPGEGFGFEREQAKNDCRAELASLRQEVANLRTRVDGTLVIRETEVVKNQRRMTQQVDHLTAQNDAIIKMLSDGCHCTCKCCCCDKKSHTRPIVIEPLRKISPSSRCYNIPSVNLGAGIRRYSYRPSTSNKGYVCKNGRLKLMSRLYRGCEQPRSYSGGFSYKVPGLGSGMNLGNLEMAATNIPRGVISGIQNSFNPVGSIGAINAPIGGSSGSISKITPSSNISSFM